MLGCNPNPYDFKTHDLGILFVLLTVDGDIPTPLQLGIPESAFVKCGIDQLHSMPRFRV